MKILGTKGLVVAMAFAGAFGLLATGCGGVVGVKTCHELTAASGTSPQTCVQDNSDTSSCTGGTSSGQCPSSGLVGCCKTSVSTGLGTVYSAACYYDSASAATEQANCTGTDQSWSTKAP
jgi:hypothetical protein